MDAKNQKQKYPDIQETIADVFIFESLKPEDEASGRLEGQRIADILRLAGKNPKYYYFQSFDELPHLIGLFRQSKYRYLHISSHASSTEILSSCESISYSRFASHFDGHLRLRRVFFSACQVGNREFLEAISRNNKGMRSFAAPRTDIRFDYAAAIWSSFYVSMFSHSIKSMSSDNIRKRLEIMMSLFPVEFFLGKYNAKGDNWKCYNLSAPEISQKSKPYTLTRD